MRQQEINKLANVLRRMKPDMLEARHVDVQKWLDAVEEMIEICNLAHENFDEDRFRMDCDYFE